MSLHIDSDGIELRSYVAKPEEPTDRGLVLCHGFPHASREAKSAGLRYAALADRISVQCDMTVLTFNFRGTGQSEGDFSLGGWLNDVRAAVDHLKYKLGVEHVWLAGFGAGGSIALHAAGVNPEIRGVAAFSARADFDDWADNWERLLEHCRAYGMIRSFDYPDDPESWRGELQLIRPIDVVGKIAPRPVMLVHGAQDERVPIADARALADAIGEAVDLRIVHGANHRLRHDPRIVALLLGWLERQR